MKARVTASLSPMPEREQVAAALDALPEHDRLVLTLRLVEGLTALETAGVLHVPVSEVDKRMVSALRALADTLAAHPELRRVA